MASPTHTPPHHPTYNVFLSQGQIAGIVRATFPEYALEEVHELEHGKSFNNRIYFIDLVPPQDDSGARLKLVLKICGHHFDARKVQNEVGALLLLNRYCPSIPAPEILAWSEDGKVIDRLHGGRVEAPSTLWQSSYGWLLISRLPGRTIEPSDLEGPHCSSLLRQLTQHVFTWRTTLPEVADMGNIRLDAQAPPASPLDVAGRQLTVGGLILANKYSPSAYHTWSEYYTYLLQDKYDHLVSAPELQPMAKRIAEPVSSFLPQVSRLPFLIARNNVNFTHMDISPRNILISKDESQANKPPVITGIIDWEFAAFLPSPMEWLNSLINQSDDWPESIYRRFLSHLSDLEREHTIDVDLPTLDPPDEECKDPDRCLCPYHTHQYLATLEKAIDHVAPWWITPNSHTDQQAQLEEDCDRAEKVVSTCLEQLRRPFK